MMTSTHIQLIRRAGLIGAFLLVAACDEGFDVLNTDTTRLISAEPVMQLNTAIVESAPNLTMLQCESSIVKQHMRIFTGVGACGNFNIDAREVSSNNWDNGYLTRLRNLVDAMARTAEDPALANLHNVLRIWKAYTVMRITDSYGAVPYTQAVAGYLEGISFPEYDTQEFIYTSEGGILEELANASAALDPDLQAPTREVLYGGDLTKWERLGNSLLLRAAMRLTKVAPNLAEQYVQEAVAGGVMQSNEDNAVIRHTSEYRNDPGTSLNGGQAHYNYLVEDFVDHLQENDDPRLEAIAVRYVGVTSSTGQTEENADRSPENQIGIPMGYNNTTIGPIAEAAGLPSFYAYSQIDRTRMMDPQAPSFLVTYAQTQLLLAEAAHRGWISGDAATFYENGIRAHMEQISENYAGTTIPSGEIETYIQTHPLDPSRALEQINAEYWIASFLIPNETWSNFRRSCYPVLPPNPLTGDLPADEHFMRRFGYPDEERSLNPNVSGGVTPDLIGTRIWWDVKVSESC